MLRQMFSKRPLLHNSSEEPVASKSTATTGSQRALPMILAVTIILHSACYIDHLAWGQMQIQWSKESIAELLAGPKTSADLRQSLETVNRIRSFAKEEVGLTIQDSFRYYVALEREKVAWNVSASEKHQLKAITYWFPIVGTIPYLGFFSEEMAKEKAEQLRTQGLDVLVRGVQGYSTLGWFQDPIFSTQLALSEFELAEFIIHETVHNTHWLPDAVTVNESLAEFTGTQAALEYLIKYFGKKSLAYQDAIKQLDRRKKFLNIYATYAKRLDSLYRTEAVKLREPKLDLEKTAEKQTEESVGSPHDTELLAKKAAIIRDFGRQWKNLAALAYGRKRVEEWEQKKRLEFNNAHFLSFLRYHSKELSMPKIYMKICGKNWNCFFETVQQKCCQAD